MRVITLSETLAAALAADAPQRVLLEFHDENNAVIAFSNEEIVMSRGVQLTAPFNAEKELTIGLCPSMQIRFSLLNDVRQLENFTFGECHAWIGARIDSGTPGLGAKTETFTENGKTALYEFAPLGIFIVERPDIVQRDIIDITANDRMSLFDDDMPDPETIGVTFPTTLGVLADKICLAVGVTLATPNFLNYDLAVNSKPSQIESRTMRDVLKWIAEAAGSIARINRNGEMEIAWFNTTGVVYTETDYKDVTPCWYETAPIDGLKVRNGSDTKESVYDADPQTESENYYVITGNPFLRGGT